MTVLIGVIQTVLTISEKEDTHGRYFDIDALAFLESLDDFSVSRIFGLRVWRVSSSFELIKC